MPNSVNFRQPFSRRTRRAFWRLPLGGHWGDVLSVAKQGGLGGENDRVFDIVCVALGCVLHAQLLPSLPFKKTRTPVSSTMVQNMS
jgi:hypothetical protein